MNPDNASAIIDKKFVMFFILIYNYYFKITFVLVTGLQPIDQYIFIIVRFINQPHVFQIINEFHAPPWFFYASKLKWSHYRSEDTAKF